MRAFYLLLLFSFFNLYSMKEKANEYQSPKDTIQQMSLNDLAGFFWENKQEDSLLGAKTAEVFMTKAKMLRDPEKIGDAYQMFIYIHFENKDEVIKYTDSIIFYTKNLQNSYYPYVGYLMRGNAFYKKERYHNALNSYIQAKNAAEANNDRAQTIIIEHKIADLKIVLGKYNEALSVYKKHYLYLLLQDSIKTDDQFYIGTLHKLAETYSKLKKFDSAHIHVKKGIEYSLSNYYKHFYPELLITSGVVSYNSEKYHSSIDSLQKAADLLNNNMSNPDVRNSYLHLGKVYYELEDDEKSLDYLKKLENYIDEFGYTYETSEAFELLRGYYVKIGDKVRLLEILEKWIQYEKDIRKKYYELGNSIVEKYDVPRLTKEKDELLLQMIDRNKTSRITTILLGSLIVFFTGIMYLYFYKRKKNTLEKVHVSALQKLKKVEGIKIRNSVVSKREISDRLKQEILKKLELFEEEHLYLKNDITLVKVSKKLKTNSTYLSKVINIEKQKNFTNYINDLRIEYCVKRIETDNKFRKFSIRSMALEVGFNNIQSFAKAFSKQKGCNPAEFIKRNDY